MSANEGRFSDAYLVIYDQLMSTDSPILKGLVRRVAVLNGSSGENLSVWQFSHAARKIAEYYSDKRTRDLNSEGIPILSDPREDQTFRVHALLTRLTLNDYIETLIRSKAGERWAVRQKYSSPGTEKGDWFEAEKDIAEFCLSVK